MNQEPNASGHDKQIAQADARTDQANTRTQQADARTDQANTRTDEANVRTQEANIRTDQANTRTEHAEQNEQALRASELSYRRLFEAARDGILILDVETGHITDANPFLIELLGFSHGEMVGKTVGELSPFKDILSNQVMLDRLQKDGYIRYEDLPLETRDGRHIAVEFVSNVYQAGNVKVIQCNIRDITDRKLTEESLRTSEERYHSLFENMLDGLAHCRMIFEENRPQDFIYLEVNKIFEKLTGLTNVVGKSVTEAIPGIWESNPEIFEIYGRVVLTGQPERFEIYLEQLKAWLAISVYRTTKECFVAVFKNITERKQAEEELRWKTAFLEAQVDSSLDGILVVNDCGHKILQNQRMNDLWKIPAHISQDKDDSVQVEFVTNRTKHPRQFADKVAYLYSHPDEVSQDEIELIDGTVLNRYSSPVRDKAGKHYGRIWVFRDITEWKRAEESLRLLESAVEQSNESIVITDAGLESPGPEIIFVNPAFTQMTGYTAAEVIGKSPRILQGPRTDKAVLRRLRQNLERGESFAGEAINYRKDGTEFDLEWQIAPLRNADGKTTHFVATQHDITARKTLEKQFRQSQKMESIGTLAGGVAHDFNNILAVIQMQSELLKGGGGLSAEQMKLADEIGATVQRAAALTRQLLLFSRKETLQLGNLDLNQSINSMTNMLRRVLGEDIEIQFKFSQLPLIVHADAGMMDQVLLNLAVNSRDAMPKGGQLIIETSAVEFDETVRAQSSQARPGIFVCLSVSDNGCGIPPENLSRIFEPFFTTKEVGKGTGLGLATLFGIVQQHQGWVNVYSEVGQGTTFRIYLPRLAGGSSQKSEQPAQSAKCGGNETILFVEDDNFLRPSVAKILSQFGYRVFAASNGAEALEIWQQHHNEIHLLLTDLVMPGGINGKELGERLLAKHPKLMVIYASGYSAEIVSKDFPLKEGVNFLTKPFQAQKLAETIRKNLDAPA